MPPYPETHSHSIKFEPQEVFQCHYCHIPTACIYQCQIENYATSESSGLITPFTIRCHYCPTCAQKHYPAGLFHLSSEHNALSCENFALLIKSLN